MRWMVLVLGLAACGGGPTGAWFGRVDCEGIDFEVEMALRSGEDGAFAGSGTWLLTTTDPETSNPTETIERFDVSIEVSKEDGERVTDATLTCTEVEVIRYLAGFREPESSTVACEQDRFADISLAWDGSAAMTVSGQDCSGMLERTGPPPQVE